jgi:hypothetical protein
MELAKHNRFFVANLELRQLLRRAEGLASCSDSVNEEELKPISARLLELASEIESGPVSDMLDAELQEEIAPYVKNFRALQQAIETIRCVMLVRSMELETAKPYFRSITEWRHAYQQTMQ